MQDSENLKFFVNTFRIGFESRVLKKSLVGTNPKWTNSNSLTPVSIANSKNSTKFINGIFKGLGNKVKESSGSNFILRLQNLFN